MNNKREIAKKLAAFLLCIVTGLLPHVCVYAQHEDGYIYGLFCTE